jgi:uncharacterized protein YcnI
MVNTTHMMQSNLFKLACLFGLSIGLQAGAYAHATLQPKQAPQGSYQRLAIAATHGCEGSATTQVIVTIPESLMGAKPMPKAGWVVETEVHDLAQPYLSHGKEIKRDVRTIIWKGGKLLDAHFDEFVIQVKVWNKTGKIYLPVTQLCEQGRLDWNQIPASATDKLPYPAPYLEVVPGEHMHH